tara:strand:- start:111 stop:425 length:315 start_codon:yes stop_codon:yes gene_type:complete
MMAARNAATTRPPIATCQTSAVFEISRAVAENEPSGLATICAAALPGAKMAQRHTATHTGLAVVARACFCQPVITIPRNSSSRSVWLYLFGSGKRVIAVRHIVT